MLLFAFHNQQKKRVYTLKFRSPYKNVLNSKTVTVALHLMSNPSQIKKFKLQCNNYYILSIIILWNRISLFLHRSNKRLYNKELRSFERKIYLFDWNMIAYLCSCVLFKLGCLEHVLNKNIYGKWQSLPNYYELLINRIYHLRISDIVLLMFFFPFILYVSFYKSVNKTGIIRIHVFIRYGTILFSEGFVYKWL